VALPPHQHFGLSFLCPREVLTKALGLRLRPLLDPKRIAQNADNMG
jgi:hypothetical protein